MRSLLLGLVLGLFAVFCSPAIGQVNMDGIFEADAVIVDPVTGKIELVCDGSCRARFSEKGVLRPALSDEEPACDKDKKAVVAAFFRAYPRQHVVRLEASRIAATGEWRYWALRP